MDDKKLVHSGKKAVSSSIYDGLYARSWLEEELDMSVPEPVLDQLRKLGLIPFGSFRIAAQVTLDGIRVAKPKSTPGNALPTEYTMTIGGETAIDAPILELYTNGASWFVKSHDNVPGPGPGDFTNEWSTVDEALSDIFDFFFDSPNRMEAKRSRERGRRG